MGGVTGDICDAAVADSAPCCTGPHTGSLVRRLAHHLAENGIATLRFDERFPGSDVASDVDVNLAALRVLQACPEVAASQVGILAYGLGAITAGVVCREAPEVAGVAFLGAVRGTGEGFIRWNWKRAARHWYEFTDEQREWLKQERPHEVIGAFCADDFIEAARCGVDRVTMRAQGLAAEFYPARLQPFIDEPAAFALSNVRCPALLMQGGDDARVDVEDCWDIYRLLTIGGNDRVEVLIVPQIDHHFQAASDDRLQRVWDCVSHESMERPVSPVALEGLVAWAKRALPDSTWRAVVTPITTTAMSSLATS
jgi:pimeloyl-ACP methyl ester carboxylesterase